LLLFVSGARWQASASAYSNYFVTIIQRGGWSLVGSANSAAEMDCSSEMASYMCNPSELRDQRCQIIVEIIVATGVWCHPHIFAANNEALKLLRSMAGFVNHTGSWHTNLLVVTLASSHKTRHCASQTQTKGQRFESLQTPKQHAGRA
jgi:hypothetical protein